MQPEPWFLTDLACPRHQLPFTFVPPRLCCPRGDTFPVIDGIPVLLVEDVEQTHESAAASLTQASEDTSTAPASGEADAGATAGVHPFVQGILPATNGIMYLGVQLSEYPIPEIRLPPARSHELLLDVGCNWGRWSVAASKKGYQTVGIDPNLKAVSAARSVARQLGVASRFVVGDARFLPFRNALFDFVFSYSVLQHLSRESVAATLRSVRRVLKADGVSEIQMLNAIGLRSFYNQAKRRFADPVGFDVRFWTPRDLLNLFSTTIGPSRLLVDGFFSANAQRSDIQKLRLQYRMVVHTSELLRRVSSRFPVVTNVADSLYVVSSENAARLAQMASVVARG